MLRSVAPRAAKASLFMVVGMAVLIALPMSSPPADGARVLIGFSDGSQARHQTQTENIRFWHTKGNELLAGRLEAWLAARGLVATGR